MPGILSDSALVNVATIVGLLGSFCFTIQYLPQAWFNYSRKSVKGFSKSGIILKLLGAAFLSVNSYLLSEPLAVFVYGISNVTQHLVFMIQFSIYPSTGPPSKLYLLWLFYPLFPAFLGLYYPSTMAFTSYAKPITQVLSHLPQLLECIRLSTTAGVSMASQHLNCFGGFAGLFMCFLIPTTSRAIVLMYCNSIFQAGSIYLLAIYYGELYGRKEKNGPAIPGAEGTKSKSGSDAEGDTPSKLLKKGSGKVLDI